jgi:hypothetical protein
MPRPTRTALHHSALTVTDVVRAADRPCTQSPMNDRPYGSVLVCRDPDNIQLEMFAHPSPQPPPSSQVVNGDAP